MPGAWEEGGREVLLAILTREFVSTYWATCLRRLWLPQGCENPFILTGMPFDHARNVACAYALKEGFQSLLFLDDDMIVPSDAYARLASHRVDIVSGLYYRRHKPVVPCMLIGNEWVTSYIQNGPIMEVDKVGAGCLLIQRHVLEKMQGPHWFDWRSDRENLPPGQARLSEDFAFCEDAKKQGFKVWVDPVIQCEHVGLGKAKLPGTFEPCSPTG